MKIVDTQLIEKLQQVEMKIREVKRNDSRYQKLQIGVNRLRDAQQAPITSEYFQNIEFHPSYNSLKKG